MFGLLYLGVSIWLGAEIFAAVFSGKNPVIQDRENGIWINLPAWFGMGTLLMTWGTYLVAWLAKVAGEIQAPLYYGNFVMFLTAAVTIFFLWRRKSRGSFSWISDKKLFRKECILFVTATVFLTFLFFYVFHVKNQVLYSGVTVFSDYSPHLSMIRSFSVSDNFPTQYPHYGGEDVKYHFMFQFLAGNLEYLGLRMDIAYNLISIMSLSGFLMLFYTLVQRIFHSFAAGALAVFFFFFRSSFSFFRFLFEHLKEGNLLQALRENVNFIGYTPNETWGFWNLNVYLNQRHLAFGLLISTFAVLVFWNWFEAGMEKEEKGTAWMRGRILSGEAWMWKHPLRGMAAGILLGLCSFWNGAAVIGGLLILCGMALYSDGKLDYLLAAAASVVLAELQAKFFMQGSGIGIRYQWGFLVPDPTIGHVIEYLLMMSGIVFCGMAVAVWFQNRRERCLLTAFLLPLVFAFTISMTPDIGVNHKYIMIAMHFVSILWAGLLVKVWKKHRTGRFLAVLLSLVLSAAGIYDVVTILRGNADGHRVGVRLNSDLTAWLIENTDSSDLILTPEYSMCDATISGMMMYCGWPYYAWSAGYDTGYREEKARMMYTTNSREELRQLVEQEGISYILYEQGSSIAEEVCREEQIADTYPLVYTSESGTVRIYKTTDY